MTVRHVRESIREVDGNSWLIDNNILLSRVPFSSECAWRDAKGMGYSISKPPFPLPETRPLSATSDAIRLVYDAGDVSAVFSIGSDAFCKVKTMIIPDATREHVTLSWLQKRTWSFTIPNVLYHAEHNGRYYLIVTRVPGGTIDSLWRSLDESMRQHCVKRIVDICTELAVSVPNGSGITGVDGNNLTELYLSGRDQDCSPQNLRKTCLELGMDCSTLVFHHCDLNPINILMDPVNGSIGVIDWEVAGFVPKEWISTKLHTSAAMVLSTGDQLDFRRRVLLRLEELRFAHVFKEFSAWVKGDDDDDDDDDPGTLDPAD